MIESLQNPQVKNIIQLIRKGKARREQSSFTAEGRKMFLEAPSSWIRKVYLTESLSSDGEILSRIDGEKLPFEIVSDQVFGRMSDTMTPQGVMTVLRTPEYRLSDFAETKAPFFMILEDLQDPGNLGTILRTGEGAGITGVILTKNSVDITNPKVIRATMGSIYRMPFFYAESVPEIAKLLAERGVTLYAAHLKGERSYDQEDYTEGTAFLIGNEARGLSDEASSCAGRLIRIPMAGKVESLNAAMASGILMYEAARQRRSVL